uniref:Pre-C2HC domain-containing protein n=1 Tax=Bactrocera tryoni TaxID=59916 RepID=A0A142LX48_BACRY|nr:hypothetical protein [Bactrocera tryoni]
MDIQTPPPGGGTQCNQIGMLLERIKKIETLNNELKNENATLKLQNENLKKSLTKYTNETSSSPSKSTFVAETDEEELEKETNWLLKKKKSRESKKRKADSSPDVTLKSPIPDGTAEDKTDTKVSHRPPPIIISENFNQPLMRSLINADVKKSYTLKLTGPSSCKINLSDSSDYRILTRKLNESKIPWYSYEDKQSRDIRVMVKDLHHSCEPESIVTDLQKQGFKVTKVLNKLQYKTKNPLNMFIVCFESTENIKKIYEIKHILNSVVKLEPIKPSNLVPQCKSCQAFGHTRNYCCKPPRCVKCAGNHTTLSCTKPAELPPKCCNCNQNHPANYRGCEVAKQLQKIKNATEKNKEHNQQPKRLSTTASTAPQKEVTNVSQQSGKPSFASITKGTNQVQQHMSANQTNSNATGDITGNFSLILNKLNKLEEQNKLTHERLTKLERQQSESKAQK